MSSESLYQIIHKIIVILIIALNTVFVFGLPNENSDLSSTTPKPRQFRFGLSRHRSLFGDYPTHTVEVIKSNNYPVEIHTVETEDGYLLEIHRIPPKVQNKKNSTTTNKFPVLLTHGNYQSSSDWVINTPTNDSFAFILHDEGYDVWLGNYRGNPYGRKHKWISPLLPRFWNFSFHEMGIYDLPATIDHILAVTGEKQVHVVALSMGPTVFLAGVSLKPEYNEKVASAVLMGSTVFMTHFYNGIVRYISFLSRFVTIYLNVFGSMPGIPYALGKVFHNFLPGICNPRADVFGLCHLWLHTVHGHDGGLITREQVAQIFATTPASGSSLKLTNHVLQMWGSGRFAEYDYGRRRNMQLYSRPTPPDYDLDKVTVPVAIFVGINDRMGHIEDAKILAKKLPNVVDFVVSPYEKFAHLNYPYGRDKAVEYYKTAIEIFKRYDKVA